MNTIETDRPDIREPDCFCQSESIATPSGDIMPLISDVICDQRLKIAISKALRGKEEKSTIEKTVLLVEVEKQFVSAQDTLWELSYNILATLVERAKSEGVDISVIEAQMPELKKNMLRTEAERQLEGVRESLWIFSYDVLVKMVIRGKKYGVDMSFVEGELPELKKQVLRSEVENKW